MRRRLVVAPALKSASVAAALCLSPLVQAASVQTVFSAENALYGAGYSVGQADGWIDDSLRAAIKQYQSDRPELSATGELDSPTLQALGISADGSRLLSGNAVNNRKAAIAELGLSETRFKKTFVQVAAAPAPEPEPQPAAEPKPAKPEPVVAEKPDPVVQKEAEPDSKPVKVAASVPETAQPEPEPAEPAVAEPEPAKKPQPKSQPQVAAVEDQPEPEPDSEPVQVTSSFGFSDSKDTERALITAEAQTESAAVTVADTASAAEETVPQEPTAAGLSPETDSDPESASEESEGNVFTKVFDFLFGWMV